LTEISNHFISLAIKNWLNYIVGMTIGNLIIKGNLFLAPLAGISNRPFRLLSRTYGAALCYTEMISSDAVVMNQKKTLAMIDIESDEHPVGVQLFGSKPEVLGKAVRRVCEFAPDLVDLNIGCPVKKVTRKNGGAALLKNLELTGELMAATVENSSVPVTIKTRTGWDAGSDVFVEIGQLAEKTGVSAITLHARSRSQNYGDRSDWSKIAHLKSELTIPVIGNGDINSPEDAQRMFEETGCDAIMIGRAAMRNPYIFKRIKAFLEDGTDIPDLDIPQKIELALEHARMVTEKYGQQLGAMKMRKHLSWYTKGFPGGANLRRRIKEVLNYTDIQDLLYGYNESEGENEAELDEQV